MTAGLDVAAVFVVRRADALVQAEELCEVRALEARVVYAETIRRARERFEAETANALAEYRRAVIPAQRDYNRSVVHAEALPNWAMNRSEEQR